MERLTQERGDRTWKIHHLAWYLNLTAFVGLLLWALYHAVAFLEEYDITTASSQPLVDLVFASGLIIAALMLFMGAGISRYQARTEGQHLELKLAINRLHDEIASLKRAAGKNSTDD